MTDLMSAAQTNLSGVTIKGDAVDEGTAGRCSVADCIPRFTWVEHPAWRRFER